MKQVFPIVLLAAACSGDPRPPVRLRATVIRPVTDTTRDTVRFETGAVAHHCEGGSGMLLEGSRGGNGFLVWLRPGDSALAGTYTPLPRADTTGRRGALAAVRFMANDVAQGTTIDSGSVIVAESGDRVEVTVGGSGLVVPGAMRVAVTAVFVRVPAPVDSVPCVVQP